MSLFEQLIQLHKKENVLKQNHKENTNEYKKLKNKIWQIEIKYNEEQISKLKW